MHTELVIFHLGICALYIAMFGEASTAKFLGRKTPQWFLDQFKPTWMSKLPLAPAFWGIALLEGAVAVLFLIGLVTGEPFNPTAAKPFMSYGLLASMFLFAALLFGQRVSFDFAGSFSAFVYGTISGLLWFALNLWLPALLPALAV